jgi:hypothetical protein
VRHVDHRRGSALLEILDLGADLDAELRVQVGQRLVEEEDGGLADERAAHRDALPLSAGELSGQALEQLLDVQHRGDALDARAAVVAAEAAHAERELEVPARREMRVQRVVLEHHRDVPLLRPEGVRHAVPDAERAARDLLEPGDQAKHRRLAASGGADRHEQLAVGNVERDVDERLRPARVRLRHVLEDDARHQSKKCSAARSGRTRAMIGSAAKWRWTAPSVRAFAAARKIIDWSRAR